jgi:carboxypeptidase Q
MMRNLNADSSTYEFYFTYHHSGGDTMSMMNADDMDDNVVAIASRFFLLANSEEALPKPL